MAEWLKKQAEREAEKEQRRLERLQRKLAEPRHQFTDPEYQQQCHDLSERLEDSVLKGLQASSSSQVKVDDVSAAKRPSSHQSQQPEKKKKKMASAGFWTGVGELDQLLSSEDEDNEDEATLSTSASSCRTVTMATQRDEAEPQSSGDQVPRGPQTSRDQVPEDQRRPESTKVSAESRCRSQQQESPEVVCPEVQCPVDLSLVTSVQQLESLGLDVLKEELMSRGLKCGGALSERAARLFSVRGLNPDQISRDLLAKPGKTRKK
ncbi:hypothetical protein INR49_008142 [Caranx melampygus]|nr:hypothetical protein INR49_008142 [Caranx melampygus]